MDELIKINYDEAIPTVSGRELHKALGVETRYTKWMERMLEYGFENERDYWLVKIVQPINNLKRVCPGLSQKPKSPTTA